MNAVKSHQDKESVSVNADNYYFFRTEINLLQKERTTDAESIPESFFEGLDECKRGEVISMEKALNEPHP